MCGGAKKDIEKSWESVGIGPAHITSDGEREGQVLNISRIPELDFLVSDAKPPDVRVPAPVFA